MRPDKAKKKNAQRAPLSNAEQEMLVNLINDARNSNLDLASAGSELDAARDDLARATERVKAAERQMIEARAQNTRVHSALAPLLHRLPTA